MTRFPKVAKILEAEIVMVKLNSKYAKSEQMCQIELFEPVQIRFFSYDRFLECVQNSPQWLSNHDSFKILTFNTSQFKLNRPRSDNPIWANLVGG